MIRRKRAIKIYSLIYAGIFILSVLAIILNAMIIPKENFPPDSMERYDTLAGSLEQRSNLFDGEAIVLTVDNYTVSMFISENDYYSTYLIYHDEKGYIKPLSSLLEHKKNFWNYHLREQSLSQDVGTMFVGDKYCSYVSVCKDEDVGAVISDNLGSKFEMQQTEMWGRHYYYFLTTIDKMPANYTVTIDGEVYEPNKWYYDQMLYPNFAFLIMLTLAAFPTGLGIIYAIYQHKYESNRRKYKDIF